MLVIFVFYQNGLFVYSSSVITTIHTEHKANWNETMITIVIHILDMPFLALGIIFLRMLFVVKNILDAD